MFVKANLCSKFLYNESFIFYYIECCSVQIRSSQSLKNNRSLKIIAIYRPPSGSVEMFNECITNTFFEHSNGREMLICGDLNLDLLSPDNDGHDTFANLYSFNFFPLISLPTRVTENSSSCLDQFWYNSFNVKQSGCFIHDITDHYTIYTTLKFSYNNKMCNISFRDHSERNIKKLCDSFHVISGCYFETKNFLCLDDRVDVLLVICP